MTTSRTDENHPFYNEKFWPEDYLKFFMKNPKKMKYTSLGEMLDFISFGGGNFVGYNQGTRGLIEIIQKWMEAQPKKIIKQIWKDLGNGVRTLKRTIKKEVYLWNRPSGDYNEKLPRINYLGCPRNNEHKEKIKDLGGRTRCAHTNKRWLREDYIEEFDSPDPISGIIKKGFYEEEPNDPTPEDAWNDETGELVDSFWRDEYNKYLEEKKEFDEEEPTILVKDTCYAIIKEPSSIYLSLETVLDRLNCLDSKVNNTIHPFSGFTLANFVKAWHNQKGKRKFFRDPKEIDSYKAFPNFQPVSSEY